ncbi:MAG: hypothetical protein HYX57_00420, partial [Chloroflexi bacterium]|nr:hypothetical protein [Chloroflexota bacterium]
AVGLAAESEISDLLDAYLAGVAPAALDRLEALADVGRDLGQVAAQAEAEARRRLLRAASDPLLSRPLAGMLRTLAEAATVGAREGRARLALELLAVVAPIGSSPQPRASAPPTRATTPTPVTRSAPARPAPAAPVDPLPARSRAAVPMPGPADPADRPGDVHGMRGRWGEVVERAAPAIKPLLRECRPIAVDGARLTLAFPEERSFMRAKAATRAPAIEQLLSTVLGGSWAIECVASNVELEPLTVAQAIVADPGDADGMALLEGVLRITGGELVDAPEVRS